MTTRCAVLGSPIDHSLSPAMHRAAYRALGLEGWTYEAIDVDVDGLPAFVDGLGPQWRGLSLTMPLKRAVVPLADETSDVVRALGVANTLDLRDGRRSASNTDVGGAVAALSERGIATPRSVRILGGGATAVSIVYALARHLPASFEVLVRDTARADDVVAVAEAAGAEVHVHTLGSPMIDKVDLLVSTVPADAVAADAHDLVDSARAVFDVVYEPWRTPLDQAAQERGRPFVSGLDLLTHQAVLQVEIMTGEHVDPQILRDAALAELARR